MATGSWDATCRIWDLKNYECIKVLENHHYAVSCEFLKNGNLVTGS